MSGSDAADTRHRISFSWRTGKREVVHGTGADTLLDAAESSGVDIPFGCRIGACGTCVGRLREGDVSYDRLPRALKPRHEEAGYVLCCLARPHSECRITVGPDVLAELVSNPWE